MCTWIILKIFSVSGCAIWFFSLPLQLVNILTAVNIERIPSKWSMQLLLCVVRKMVGSTHLTRGQSCHHPRCGCWAMSARSTRPVGIPVAATEWCWWHWHCCPPPVPQAQWHYSSPENHPEGERSHAADSAIHTNIDTSIVQHKPTMTLCSQAGI